MASPSVRSKSAGEGAGSGGGSSNISVTLPATISAGDTLIVFICQDGMNLLEDGDSGFTYLGGGVHSTSQIAGGVFWKKATGSEDGTTVGFHGTASLDFAYCAYAFQDASDPTITPPTLSSSAEGTDNTAEPPECDPGVSKDYYWLAVAGCDYRAFNTYPTDMTLDRQKAGTSGMLNASAAAAGKQSTASSYAPTGNFELSASNEWLAWTVGIHPAGDTAINITGTIGAAATVQGDLAQTFYVPPVVTGVGPFLEYYDPDPSVTAWVDISNYVRSWWVDWGASGVQEQIRARTATFILDNNDRRFEPMYADGAYYPAITVGTYINCGLTITADDSTVTTFPLFYGVAQAWRPGYSAPPARDMICRLEACDPNVTIAGDLTSVNLPAQRSDQDISDLLDEMMWTGGIIKDLETGDSTLQAYDATKESVLSLINSVVNSEGGWFYWQPNHHTITARFLNRNYLSVNVDTETVYYLDDNGDKGQYTDIVFSSADDHIYTRALITRKGGTQQSYSNSTLAGELGERTYTASNLLLATDNEAYDRAAFIVETRARAAYNLYCSTIRANLALGQERYDHGANVLGLTQPFAPFVITHTPKVGTALSFDCRVVGGSIGQRSPGDLVEIVGNMVDAVVLGGDFWILQDPVMGLLGTTTVLGW